MKRSIEGSVYKTEDGRSWYARVQYTDIDGRKRQKKRMCKTHAAAKEMVKVLRDEIEADCSDRKTYRQLDRFFREKYVHEAQFVGGKKLSGYRQDLKALVHYLDTALEFFGDQYIDSITYADLQRYKEGITNRRTQHNRQRSVSDINHHLKRVRKLLNVAIEQAWLSVNPFNRGSALIVDSFEAERTRILSPAEESRLLSQCNEWRRHLKPIIIFAVETGCRRGEIQAVKWETVNLDGRCIKIESFTTKTLKPRLVPISARLLKVLNEMWRNSPQSPDAHLFGGSDFKRAFGNACRDAELDDVHFHDLRHTAITRMLEKGISPALVMKISGHTQQRTFLRYVNQSESSVFEIAMRLDKAA